MEYRYLLKVEGEANNNKYYEMIPQDHGTFKVNYGRVGSSAQTEVYPGHRFLKKLKEKEKKGYKDITHLKVESTTGEVTVEDPHVSSFYHTFLKYTTNSVKLNYTIAVGNVTQLQLTEAQSIIDALVGISKKLNPTEINKHLTELYAVVPRAMRNVRDYLVTPEVDITTLNTLIAKEQDVLDSLKSNVIVSVKENVSLEDTLGVKIVPETNLAFLESLLYPTNSSSKRIYKAFKITHEVGQKRFDDYLAGAKNQKTEYLIHGTRNANVFSILKSGLLIRPSNAVTFAGSAYGDGVYHSAHTDKSMGYTGHDNDKLFLIQNVHVGNQFVYEGWYRGNDFNLDYENLQKRGYDSTYVKPGNGLRNSEYIVYNHAQTVTSYLTWWR